MITSRLAKTTVSVVATVAALSVAVPAHAAVPVLARVNLSIAPASATSSRICWDGYVDDSPFLSGLWIVSVTAARSNGTTVTPVPTASSGSVLPVGCTVISNAGAAAGVVHVVVSLAGVGADVTAACDLTAFWTSPASAPQPLAITCTDTALVAHLTTAHERND